MTPTPNVLLNRDLILSAPDHSTVKVQVPEWGGFVFVRTLTAGERDTLEVAQSKTPGVNFRARWVAMTTCNETGAPAFTEADIPALGLKCASAVDRIFQASAKLNRVTSDDLDDAEKNS